MAEANDLLHQRACAPAPTAPAQPDPKTFVEEQLSGGEQRLAQAGQRLTARSKKQRWESRDPALLCSAWGLVFFCSLSIGTMTGMTAGMEQHQQIVISALAGLLFVLIFSAFLRFTSNPAENREQVARLEHRLAYWRASLRAMPQASWRCLERVEDLLDDINMLNSSIGQD